MTRRPIISGKVGWLLAASAIVLLALGRLWWLPAHAPLNVNEGWNAGHMVRAFGGVPLYPDPDSLIANNYPPLSFYIVGVLGQAIGDDIVAGRILALLAQLATGAAVWAMVTRLVPGRRWAAAGALIFAAFAATLLRSYLAINDPQWLGHAAMSWAIVALTPRRAGDRPGFGAILFAAALMVAGGLIKHNLVAFPVAASLWLLLLDRRSFAIWVAVGTAIAAAACLGLFALWGMTVFTDVLGPARSYSLVRMLAKGGPLLLALAPAAIACRPLLARWRDDRRLALPLLLLAVAVPIGIVQRSGSGVDVNAFFETVIALAIAVPVATALRPRPAWAWVGISVLPALCLVPVAAARTVAELAGRDAAVRHWAPFIAAIGRAPGPVACDDQAVCYWAGRASAIDFFSVKQRLLHNRAEALTPALAEGRFAMIQMRGENPGWQENRLIPAIRAHYVPVYRAEGIELLVPSRGSAPPAR